MSKTTRKPKTTEPTSQEIQASIREFAKQMSPAPAAPSYLDTFFTPDAETARRWAIVKAAAGR